METNLFFYCHQTPIDDKFPRNRKFQHRNNVKDSPTNIVFALVDQISILAIEADARIIYFLHRATIWHLQCATIRHSNIYQILVSVLRMQLSAIWKKSEHRDPVGAAFSFPRPAIRPLARSSTSRFPRFSSSNLATRPCRSVSLRRTRKPFLSSALCVYPLSTFLLFCSPRSSRHRLAVERVSFLDVPSSVSR